MSAAKSTVAAKNTLSIVISAYNEEPNINALYEEIIAVLGGLKLAAYEIIFVNDGSDDRTLQVCTALAMQDPNVRVVHLVRNFGHEIAMTAGMDHSRYDGVLFMDADFQHPPSLIPRMVELWQECDLVLTRRTYNHGKSWSQELMAKVYYRLLNFLSEVPIPANMPDFRLLDRKYVDLIRQMNESERLFRGMLNWIGFENAKFLEFEAPQRKFGNTKYNFKVSSKLAINSILQFSIKPLRLSIYVGVLTAIAAIGLAVYTAWSHFVYGAAKTGYATTIVVVVLMGSIQLIMMGIIGEYIGRIHIEVKRRPLYFANYIKFGDNSGGTDTPHRG